MFANRVQCFCQPGSRRIALARQAHRPLANHGHRIVAYARKFTQHRNIGARTRSPIRADARRQSAVLQQRAHQHDAFIAKLCHLPPPRPQRILRSVSQAKVDTWIGKSGHNYPAMHRDINGVPRLLHVFQPSCGPHGNNLSVADQNRAVGNDGQISKLSTPTGAWIPS